MATKSAVKKTKQKGSREIQREQTRVRILQAVLDIMVENGVRAIRHRAVAKRAGVSLGSTTYHFSSIEDLIVSAFDYFNKRDMMTINPHYGEVKKRLEPYQDDVVPQSLRPGMATWFCEQSVAYVCGQVAGNHYNRIVELAFYHESIRYPSLRALLTTVRQVELEFLTQVHRIMGSQQPTEDARITVALFRQLEQSVVMKVPPGLDSDVIRQTIQRHLSLCLNIPLPSVTTVDS